jgi:Lon protease-like protein
LPLFLLDFVLLPGGQLPLHIFEPRYKEMISECLTSRGRFGVLHAKEEKIAQVGCSARIVNLSKTYADGRMDLLTEGLDRFEVVRTVAERSFLQAEVFYPEDVTDPVPQEQVTLVRRLYGELLTISGSHPEAELEHSPHPLSYQLAGRLPLDPAFKQRLLETRSEKERTEALVSFFQAVLPSMRHSARVREKAGGNGYVGA